MFEYTRISFSFLFAGDFCFLFWLLAFEFFGFSSMATGDMRHDVTIVFNYQWMVGSYTHRERERPRHTDTRGQDKRGPVPGHPEQSSHEKSF